MTNWSHQISDASIAEPPRSIPTKVLWRCEDCIGYPSRFVPVSPMVGRGVVASEA